MTHKKILNETQLRSIIKHMVCEALTTSYRNNLRSELQHKVPDWNFDSWSDEEDENNKQKAIKAGVHSNLLDRETESKDFNSEMKKLGFKKLQKKDLFNTIDTYMIDEHEFISVKEKYKQLLNFFGYIQTEIQHGEDTVFVTTEPKYGRKETTNSIYFHATKSSHVNKILRNGLVPRDEGKLDDARGARIYLIKHYDRFLFNELFPDEDYTVFKVDLSDIKDNIKVYTDELAQDSVYTYDNIPPKCLTIV